ncbi:MAG: hypothetical protein ABI628_11940 [Chloroflexota bacterium]
MRYLRQADVVLAMSREAERDLEALPPESPQAKSLQAEAAQLRQKYDRLISPWHLDARAEPPTDAA